MENNQMDEESYLDKYNNNLKYFTNLTDKKLSFDLTGNNNSISEEVFLNFFSSNNNNVIDI